MSGFPTKINGNGPDFELTAKRRLIASGIVVCVWLVRLFILILPDRLTVAIARGFGRCSAYFCKRELKLSLAQLRVALGVTNRTSGTRIFSDSLANLGQSVVETMQVKKIIRTTGAKTPDGFPVFRRIDFFGEPGQLIRDGNRRGRGILAISGHIGPIEVLAAAQAQCGMKLSTIGRLPNYSTLKDYIQKIRNGYDTDTIWRDDPSSTRKLIKQLHEGRVIAILIDQDVDLDMEFAPFFGIEAGSPTGLIKMAIKLNIPIFTTFIVRAPSRRFQIIDQEIKYDPADPQASINVLREYNQRLETLIRRYPAQWIWWHKRWRRRPGVNYRFDIWALRRNPLYLHWLDSLPAGKPLAQIEESAGVRLQDPTELRNANAQR